MRIAAGRFKGRQLPTVNEARPVGARLKTSLFTVLAPYLEGARVLDVCAGVGGLGLEALSRGASHVTLVENDRQAVRALGAWLKKYELGDACTVLARDALGPAWPAGPFDLVFLDPPFGFFEDGRIEQLLSRAAAVLAPEGLVAVKAPEEAAVPELADLTLHKQGRAASVAYWLLASH